MSLRPAIPRRVDLHQSPLPLCRPFPYWRSPAHRASLRCDRVDFALSRMLTAPRRGLPSPPGHELSGSNDLPWALTRILHANPKIKRRSGAGDRLGVRAPAVVCSKNANGVFIPCGPASAIAASIAGGRRGNGRAGRPSKNTAPRRWEKQSGTDRAAVTVSASETGIKHRRKRQPRRPRG
jgi:hypothetical protein